MQKASERYCKQVVESSMLAPPSIFQACLIVDGNVARHPATSTGVFNHSSVYSTTDCKVVGISVSTI